MNRRMLVYPFIEIMDMKEEPNTDSRTDLLVQRREERKIIDIIDDS